MVWTSTELAIMREKHESQTRRVTDLEMQLSHAQGGSCVGGDGGSTQLPSKAHMQAAMAADMVVSLRQLLAYGQDEVELLHEHIHMLNVRGSQANGQPASPRPTGEMGQEEANVDGHGVGAGPHVGAGTHRKAYSVEEWRSLLAVRSLNGFGSFGIKRPVFSTVRHTYFGPNS